MRIAHKNPYETFFECEFLKNSDIYRPSTGSPATVARQQMQLVDSRKRLYIHAPRCLLSVQILLGEKTDSGKENEINTK